MTNAETVHVAASAFSHLCERSRKMKVLLINGSPNEHGCTYTALKEVESKITENGIDTEILWIGNKAINGCVACGGCFRARNGHCVFGDSDGVNAIADKMFEADGIIIGSPVHFSSPAGNLISLLDRIFYFSRPLAGKPAAAVVSCRRSGGTASFDVLNKYFTIAGMPIVSSKYWNVVHGRTPEDVKKDLEGMQVMRTLGNNMSWMLKCIEAGKEKGNSYPKLEPVVMTNFIR